LYFAEWRFVMVVSLHSIRAGPSVSGGAISTAASHHPS
jgi:hypothetical protein